ncbi:MAG: nucleotidyltransferase domain-containing protein [Actinomycetota bacterium]|nr:nucleotidyltransferase domain-containing protein [Actinomycetota bacterium]
MSEQQASHPVIVRRRAEQAHLVQRAAAWAQRLAGRLPLDAAVVFGSAARGDFNRWSDVDVLVVSVALPDDARQRLEVLMDDAPPGIQPVGWTPEELARRRSEGDPIARECDEVGRTVYGALPPAPRRSGD